MAWRYHLFHSRYPIIVLNDFDLIAPIYDRLADLVFGKSIINCQIEYFYLIPPNAHILIVGGGTGWIVNFILNQSKNATIVYVEKSRKMIEITKSKIKGEHLGKITFYAGSIENFDSNEQFDVVINNFFLDLFALDNLKQVLKRTKQILKPEGLFLVSDFQLENTWRANLWQRPLMALMHLFFRVFANLDSDDLKQIKEEVQLTGFQIIKEKNYFGRMIFSAVYSIKE